jgi:hypothetical protein
MQTKEVLFGELKQGDRFAMSPRHFEDGDEFVNMKVGPAVLCDDKVDHIPYNVIRLRDGSVRTFRDERKVWIVEEQS